MSQKLIEKKRRWAHLRKNAKMKRDLTVNMILTTLAIVVPLLVENQVLLALCSVPVTISIWLILIKIASL